MEDWKTKYSDVIIHSALNLQEGESLSINTNPSTLDFSQQLARVACEITLQQVNVVLVDHGIPKEVIPFHPLENDQLSAGPTGFVLLRLDDTEEREWNPQDAPEEIVRDMALLQKHGILCPPPLNRQVAPWALLAVPGPVWAMKLLGQNASEEDLWQLLSSTLKLNCLHPTEAWNDQARLIQQRLDTLNGLQIDHLHFHDDETDLEVGLVQGSHWRGGRQSLPNGRVFIPQFPLERVSALPARNAVNGTVRSSKPIHLLGGIVEGASFIFEQGRIMSHQALKGDHLLDLLFSVDDGASYLGEITLIDEANPLSAFSDFYGHSGFDDNLSTSIVFGGGDALYISESPMFESSQDLQERTGCNTSDIHAPVKIGTRHLKVTAVLTDGSQQTIMENGRFLF